MSAYHVVKIGSIICDIEEIIAKRRDKAIKDAMNSARPIESGMRDGAVGSISGTTKIAHRGL